MKLFEIRINSLLLYFCISLEKNPELAAYDRLIGCVDGRLRQLSATKATGRLANGYPRNGCLAPSQLLAATVMLARLDGCLAPSQLLAAAVMLARLDGCLAPNQLLAGALMLAGLVGWLAGYRLAQLLLSG